MDIAGLSMSMASNNLQTKIGTAVLSKAMDTNEAHFFCFFHTIHAPCEYFSP